MPLILLTSLSPGSSKSFHSPSKDLRPPKVYCRICEPRNKFSSDRVTLGDLETINNLSIHEQTLIKGLDKRLSKVSTTGADFVAKLRHDGVIPKGNITVGDISKISAKVDEEIVARKLQLATQLKRMDGQI